MRSEMAFGASRSTCRRHFVVATAALCAAPALRSQVLPPTRLIALRSPGLSPTNACVSPCIRGRLFDVSDTEGPLEQLMPATIRLSRALCDLIERPWKGNQPNVSSIKRGLYRATVRRDATKPWMSSPYRAWRLELMGTAPRSAIQFHYGQDVSWSEGCFIVGRLLQGADAQGVTQRYCVVDEGEAAIARIRSAVETPGRSAEIQIAVADDAGLFSALNGTPSC